MRWVESDYVTFQILARHGYLNKSLYDMHLRDDIGCLCVGERRGQASRPTVLSGIRGPGISIDIVCSNIENNSRQRKVTTKFHIQNAPSSQRLGV